MMENTCPYCNSAVLPGTIFCDNCGSDLRVFPPTSTSPAIPPVAPLETAQGEVCSNCQHDNRPGALFCERCGAKLLSFRTPAPESLPVYHPPIAPGSRTRLVIPSANFSLDLPLDNQEMILGREDLVSGIFPDINLEPYGAQDNGVSRRHARLIHAGDSWLIEDLNSVNRTYLNRQFVAPNQPMPLRPGDELCLGKLVILFQQD
jgi:hypothetical protein